MYQSNYNRFESQLNRFRIEIADKASLHLFSLEGNKPKFDANHTANKQQQN